MLIAACSSGAPQRVGVQPSWRHGETTGSGGAATGISVGPVTFAPASEPATRYNEPAQLPPHSVLGDAVLRAVGDAAVHANLAVPIADARLFRACAELAAVVPEEGIVSYGLVEFALQRNGIVEPSPHLLVVWGDVDAPDQIVEQLKPRIGEILADGTSTRVGVGAVKRMPDGSGAVVFALQASGVLTSPIPRSVAAGGSFDVEAVVDARYHEPELFVTYDDGATERLAIDTGHGGAFKAKVGCGKHRGRQQLEITASDTAGSTVLANFPVWCGEEPPVTLTVEPTRDDLVTATPAEAEHRLLALINRDRQAAGLYALVWDERVAEVSRKHAEEMRRTKIVAHISPTTGSAADRVRVASVKTAVVLENVARAYGVGEAHDGLMNSPGHRANLMTQSATHVGIGVVLGEEVSGRREMFVAQVFIRIPPKIDPGSASELVRTRIDSVRHVAVNAKLASVAQELADGLASGQARDALWPSARAKLDKMGQSYGRVGSVITAVADLETVEGKQILGDYKPDDIGIGLAQGNHPEIGDGAIWIVVLMGETRH
ncbi:MAG: SCP-like extracellular [Myxococcales bacterium]|nr:SCP-like extracellular [Myxococcales bacterium]